MKASDLLVECMEDEGVEHVFGLPGEETGDLQFSLHDSDVTFVPVRHEQGAAFMANVHGRLTGSAGVCLSTLGPGATNLLTGVADANLDKAPLVALTAQAGTERLHKESHQLLDIVDMFDPVTKWNTQVEAPDTVNESVRKAFKLAEYEKPGATHLELPEDVAGAETDAESLGGGKPVQRPSPDPESLDAVVDLLDGAERPLLIVGNGAVRAAASEYVREFVDATDVPVASTYMGKGVVPDDDERSLMTLDSGDEAQASQAIQSADLVVTAGYDIAEHDPEGWNPSGDAAIVHVDSEPAEVYEHYDPDVEVVADIAATMRELVAECESAVDVGFDTEWYADLREQIVADVADRPDRDEPLTLEGVMPVLRDAMADEDVLVSDVGRHKMVIAQNFPAYEPNTCIISNGLASMGIAVPGGVSADLAVDGNVVVGTGDGGFLMNGAELATAVHMDLGFTVLVFDDGEYSLITDEFEELFGEAVDTYLTNPDFSAFAESFGIEGYRPGSYDELREVLESTVPSDEMAVVDVPLDR